MADKQDYGVTISIEIVLLVLFIGLKLGGAIEWSWLWVLSPLWAMPVLILLLASFFAIGAGVCAVVILVMDWFAGD